MNKMSEPGNTSSGKSSAEEVSVADAKDINLNARDAEVKDAKVRDVFIERFLDAIWAERGLSDNSLSSYRHDLQHLRDSLAIHSVTLHSSARRYRFSMVSLVIIFFE